MFTKQQESGAMREKEMPSKPIYLNTNTLTNHIWFGPYVLLPMITTGVWLGGLLALLGVWVHAGKPRYMSDESSVVYISDVGASHKTLFICICVCTSAFYILSLFAERWLRHVDRLPADVRVREKIFDWMAIFFTIVGSAGLILLSIFDAFNHSTIHWSMTVVFVVAVAFSAIFQSAEIWSLHKDHPDRRHLKRNSVLKLVIVLTAVVCAIAFGICYYYSTSTKHCNNDVSSSYCNGVSNASAAMEWTVAFILVLYFATLVADLWPAGKTSPRYMRRLARWQEKHDPHSEHNFIGRKAFGQRGAWEGRNGHALDPNDGLASGRPSTALGSEAGLMRQV